MKKKGSPFWNDYDWSPAGLACPATVLMVEFAPDGAKAQLGQLRLGRWLPAVVMMAALGTAAIAATLLVQSGPQAVRFFVCGPFGALFLSISAWVLRTALRGQQTDPGFLRCAWQRALELAEIISADRLPQPTLPPTPPPPMWPEECADRGLRVYRAEHKGRLREPLDAVVQGDRLDLYASNSLAGDEVIITENLDSAATFRHGPRWSGYLRVPHVRMIVRCTASLSTMQIRVARPLQGAVFAALFAAAAVAAIHAAIRDYPSEGAIVLAVAALFAAMAAGLAVLLVRRFVRLHREVRRLRHAWDRARARAVSAPSSVGA